MAWEYRERGSLYYTRSRRVGGRIVREYVGGGLIGMLASLQDELEREERRLKAAEARRAWEAERSRLSEADGPVEGLSAACTAIAGTALQAAGYHRHHRGEWRKRRD